jgi:hypothetical protein
VAIFLPEPPPSPLEIRQATRLARVALVWSRCEVIVRVRPDAGGTIRAGRAPCTERPHGATVFGMSADPIRAAYEALMTGDVEPLVSLIHPDMEWRGRRRLRRFWQRPPS